MDWVHAGSPAFDARAKSFSVSPDKSNIYVIYVSQPWWLAGNWADVFLDEAHVGTVTRGYYRLYTVTPATHSVGEGKQYVYKQVVLTTEAGKNYFVRISEHDGNWLRNTWLSIEIIDEEEGRNLVLKSKLGGEYRKRPITNTPKPPAQSSTCGDTSKKDG
jgi:hypothetical protein